MSEPVAWMYNIADDDLNDVTQRKSVMQAWKDKSRIVPLYAAPPPAPAKAKGEPVHPIQHRDWCAYLMDGQACTCDGAWSVRPSTAAPHPAADEARDAARYRWLRDTFETQQGSSYVNWSTRFPRMRGYSLQDFDNAVDDAIRTSAMQETSSALKTGSTVSATDPDPAFAEAIDAARNQ
jgi:hypothetical protein